MEAEETPGGVDGLRRHHLFVHCVAYVSSFWKPLCVQSCPMQVAFGIRVLWKPQGRLCLSSGEMLRLNIFILL